MRRKFRWPNWFTFNAGSLQDKPDNSSAKTYDAAVDRAAAGLRRYKQYRCEHKELECPCTELLLSLAPLVEAHFKKYRTLDNFELVAKYISAAAENPEKKSSPPAPWKDAKGAKLNEGPML